MRLRQAIKKSCFFLRRYWLGFFRLPGEITHIDTASVDSILVIRLDRIGDFVVSVPAIRYLKKIFPASRITALVNPDIVPLAKLVPEINEAIAYRGFRDAVRKFRPKKFVLVIDLLLDYPLKPALLARSIKPRITAGFDIEARGRLFTIAVFPTEKKQLMSEHLLDLSRCLAQLTGKKEEDIPKEDPVWVLDPREKSFAQGYYQQIGIQAQDCVIGIAPGAKFPSQCWKETGFAQLADRLAVKYKAKIVIISSDAEKERVDKIIAIMKDKPAVVAGLPLDKLAAIISRMKVLVCNNSGPMHLAAALGVATVSAMGPTVPYLWWPQGNKHIVIRRDLFCSPCDLAVCRRHECLESISADEMAQAVDIVLENEDKNRG